jgi:hypothetical protein
VKVNKWKASKDQLFRGDLIAGIRPPAPSADDSIVRHILYLEGPGRETPYLSTSEDLETAKYFGEKQTVWKTSVQIAKSHKVGHISNSELLTLLKGNGKGKATWDQAYEVMTARRYVEQWSEHLLDFRDNADVNASTAAVFTKK